MSMKPTPFDEEITSLKEQIEAIEEAQLAPLQKTLKEQLQHRAEYLCPFKVGDVVTRTLGQKRVIRARVSKIGANHYVGYNVWGIRILTDGTDGQGIYLNSFDHWVKEGDEHGS